MTSSATPAESSDPAVATDTPAQAAATEPSKPQDTSTGYAVDSPPATQNHLPEAATQAPVADPTPTVTTTSGNAHDVPAPQSGDVQPPLAQQPAPVSGPVSELQAMFPNVDVAVLEAVLEAHGNDPSQCISDLLCMSDPNYKTNPRDAIDGDEALARRLAAEDEASRWQPQVPDQQQGQYSNLPYQPRVRPSQGQTGFSSQTQDQSSSAPPASMIPGWQPGLSQGGKDEIQKLQEEFTRFAGVGKKTMTDWFGKAKAKVAELQATRTEQSQMQAAANESNSEAAPYNWSNNTSQAPQTVSNVRANTNSNVKPSRLTGNLQHSSRYDSQPSNVPVSSGDISQNRSISQSGLDERPSVPTFNTPNAQAGAPSVPASGGASGTAKVAGAAAVGAGVGVAGATIAHREDDEDSLEYTRNPFEDDD